MSLRAKILAYVVPVMALVFVMVVATLTPDLMQPQFRRATAADATLALKNMLERLALRQIDEAFRASQPDVFRGQVLDGWILIGHDFSVHAWMLPTPEGKGESESRPVRVDSDFIAAQQFDHFHPVLTRDGKRLRLYARTSLIAPGPALDLWGLGAVMISGTLFLALVIYGLMLRLVVKPVERLAAASRTRLSPAPSERGGTALRLLPQVPHTSRQDEIGELVRAYNQMSGEVNDLRINLEKRVREATHNLEAAQNQIVLSERLSVAGRIAAGVAHEINNPLGGMLNAARSLQAKAPSGSRECEYLDLILEGLSRIQGIVASMLQFSRPAQQASRVELTEVIEGALLFCEHRFSRLNLKLVKDFAAGTAGAATEATKTGTEAGPTDGNGSSPMPMPNSAPSAHSPDDSASTAVWGHRSELGQVFLNLIMNALDAMEARGPLDRPAGTPALPLPEAPRHTLTLRLRREGASVIVSIRDTGIGMAPEVKEKAGQFFYSTKSEGRGTGLGLAVVQHIVVQHGGAISIESETGQGTHVRLTLPADATRTGQAEIPIAQAAKAETSTKPE